MTSKEALRRLGTRFCALCEHGVPQFVIVERMGYNQLAIERGKHPITANRGDEPLARVDLCKHCYHVCERRAEELRQAARREGAG